MLRDLRGTPLAEGAERVYFAGAKEMEMEQACDRQGVPLVAETWGQLQQIGAKYEVALPPVVEKDV